MTEPETLVKLVEDAKSKGEKVRKDMERLRNLASKLTDFLEEEGSCNVWIDNAVYEIRKNDPGGVYRHVTQEKRETSFLELEYIRVY